MAISDKPGGSTRTVVRRASDGTTRVLNYPGLKYYNDKVVRSVNGVKPDQNGNVNTKGGAGSAQTKPSYWDDPLIHRIEIKPEDWNLTNGMTAPDCGLFFRTSVFFSWTGTEHKTHLVPISELVNDSDRQIDHIIEDGGVYAVGIVEYYRIITFETDLSIDPSSGIGAELVYANSGDLPPVEQGYMILDTDGGYSQTALTHFPEIEPYDSDQVPTYSTTYAAPYAARGKQRGRSDLIAAQHESDLHASLKDKALIYLITGVYRRCVYDSKGSYWVEVKHDDCQEHFPDKPIYLVVRESPDSTADTLYVPRDPNGPKGSPEDNGIGVEEEPEVTADLDGIAEAALKLATPRKIALTGEALGSGQFDGSKDIDIYTTVERITNTELEEALK